MMGSNCAKAVLSDSACVTEVKALEAEHCSVREKRWSCHFIICSTYGSTLLLFFFSDCFNLT